MVLTGYAQRIEGDVAPAQIIDPELAVGGDPAVLAAHCLEVVDPGFAERAREGDILVLSGALGGGEDAEPAVIALQAAGIAAVVCAGAHPEPAAIGVTYGLPMLALPEVLPHIAAGDLLRLDLERGRLDTVGGRWSFPPLPPEALAATRRAQLLARMRRVVEDEGYAE